MCRWAPGPAATRLVTRAMAAEALAQPTTWWWWRYFFKDLFCIARMFEIQISSKKPSSFQHRIGSCSYDDDNDGSHFQISFIFRVRGGKAGNWSVKRQLLSLSGEVCMQEK